MSRLCTGFEMWYSPTIGKFITSADGETSGMVAEVKVTSDGVVAKLESGEEVPIGPGVSIKAEA